MNTIAVTRARGDADVGKHGGRGRHVTFTKLTEYIEIEAAFHSLVFRGKKTSAVE